MFQNQNSKKKKMCYVNDNFFILNKQPSANLKKKNRQLYHIPANSVLSVGAHLNSVTVAFSVLCS